MIYLPKELDSSEFVQVGKSIFAIQIADDVYAPEIKVRKVENLHEES